MPISLHSTLITNNPLERCSFYLNRGACLTNLYSYTESSAVHLIISACCALIGLRCKEWLKMQWSQLRPLCGFSLHKPDKFVLTASTLHHHSVCLCVRLGWWLYFPAHRSLFDQLNQDIFVLCVFLCPPCGCENILNPPDTQLERAPTWPPTRIDTKKAHLKQRLRAAWQNAPTNEPSINTALFWLIDVYFINRKYDFN